MKIVARNMQTFSKEKFETSHTQLEVAEMLDSNPRSGIDVEISFVGPDMLMHVDGTSSQDINRFIDETKNALTNRCCAY